MFARSEWCAEHGVDQLERLLEERLRRRGEL
jgi:hypothetical protein